MSQHVDKGVFFQGGNEVPKGTILLTPDAAFAAEVARDKKIKEKSKDTYVEQVKLLAQKYEDFLADNSITEQVEKHGIEWVGGGFIVHLFVADFAAESKLILEASINQKATPYAKVISASPHNTLEPSKRINVGDILHLGDYLANTVTNPGWVQYMGQGQSTNQKQVGKPPIQYIRAVYKFITDGKLYYPDKSKFILDSDMSLLMDKDLAKFPGPFVFELDEYSVGSKKVTKNPFK